jgi:hypothetical protein
MLADGNWKMALNMAPQKFTTAEGIEQLERQCRDIMTAGFRLDWPHLVRWAEGGQLILRGHLKWLLDASFKLFCWAKVQTRNVNALVLNQQNESFGGKSSSTSADLLTNFLCLSFHTS